MTDSSKFCLQACFIQSEDEAQAHHASHLKTSVSASRRFFATTTTTSFFPSTQFTSHDSLPSIEEAFAQFIGSYPNYADTYRIDEIRAQEYYHLCLSNHVCLDYIGIGLFSFSQLHKQLHLTTGPEQASTSSYQPPQAQDPTQVPDLPLFTLSYRSVNLKSELTNSAHESNLESTIKKRIMSFLNLSEDDYSVVFTANRTSAFKILAESYPFQPHQRLLTVYDHQSDSVETLISSSCKRGAKPIQAEFVWPRLRISSTKLKGMLVGKSGASNKKNKKKGLFVFQLQSRVTGARYSYQWMKVAQENGWYVLLDACALGPKDMDSLGLSILQPDFIVCSFYKVFGENPSGFGCLLVKKSVVPILEDSTIVGIASINPPNKLFLQPDEPKETYTGVLDHIQMANYSASQQDQQTPGNATSSPVIPQSGQLNLELGESRGISTDSGSVQHNGGIGETSPEITESKSTFGTPENIDPAKPTKKDSTLLEFRCLDHVDSLGLTLINSRGRYLTNWLINALLKLQHPNTEKGIPLVRIYGPKIKFDRGPALAFNVFDWKGERVEPLLVQKLADRKNISLSLGFLHNILFPEKYEGEKGSVLEETRRKWETDGTGRTINGGRNGRHRRERDDEEGVRVVTVAVGFLANFNDVYMLWVFVAQFLDADFVERERWRYKALDRQTN